MRNLRRQEALQENIFITCASISTFTFRESSLRDTCVGPEQYCPPCPASPHHCTPPQLAAFPGEPLATGGRPQRPTEQIYHLLPRSWPALTRPFPHRPDLWRAGTSSHMVRCIVRPAHLAVWLAPPGLAVQLRMTGGTIVNE